MTTEPKIEFWELDRIIPFDKNVKIHDKAQIKALARNFKEFGVDQPIVVDQEGVIIKGHGRRLAAIEAKMIKFPVIQRTDLTPEQVAAARLADNQVTSTKYDTMGLQEQLLELSDHFELIELGWTDKELEFLQNDIGELAADAFSTDIVTAVEEQKTANDERMEELGKAQMSVGEALGFKKVTPEQARLIRGFVAQCEEETGEIGADALIEFIKALGVE
jgi:ParB-like chromosome segregation protein Spo0J